MHIVAENGESSHKVPHA